MDRSRRTSVTRKSKWLGSAVIGRQMGCTREHRAFDRSSGQTDLEYLICELGYKHERGSEGGVKKDQKGQLTVIPSARHVVPRTGLVASELVHSFRQGPLRLAELNHTRLEVVKWSFHEAGPFLVVS